MIRNSGGEKRKRTSSRPSRMVLIACGVFALMIAGLGRASAEEGIALALVYDTSGSMKDNVPTADGKYAPKYVIANRTLHSIINRISLFATNANSAGTHRIESGLFVFEGAGAREAVKFGSFDPVPLHSWVSRFSTPDGGTPLGNALSIATRAVLTSPLTHKHVVIITDGVNTSGPKPETIMPELKQSASRAGAEVSFHFVAFDVDAKVFAPVKKLGATVLSASNEEQLNAQIGFIFEKRILLEDEEPAKPAPTQSK
ncbi:MAG TPA: vWA domain-containing protein [Candidatus Saccharimonadales bacterium]|nr:vWA domain-containing protein [Candidatus Saccharimonadales bacterium]